MGKLATALFAASVLLCGCYEMRQSRARSTVRYNGTVLERLFDGKTLNGWSGNPAIWSVKDGAIHGIAEHGGQLILTRREYSDFRLILKSRLVSEDNHLGVCFWGERKPDWGYGDCILVIPPTGGMWDYHPGKKGPPREKLPHPDFDPHVWHESEILAHLKTGTIRMAVNGIEVSRYTDKDATRLRKGPIGLQIHAGPSEVQYKDIRIELEPKEDRLLTVKSVAQTGS